MLKAGESHLRSGNLNSSLGPDLLALLSKSAPLLWHDWLAALLLGKCLLSDLVVRLRDRNAWHSHALSLDKASRQGRVIHLLVEGWVVSALSVDVVSQKVVAVIDTAYGRIDVAFSVSMEGWLAEVCRER